jgi:transposase InsO family protein
MGEALRVGRARVVQGSIPTAAQPPPFRTPAEIEAIVKAVRVRLDHDDLFCGGQAIHWELEEMGIRPLVSVSTIERILRRQGLTHRRGKRYEPKGKAYPELPALQPNQTHQADLVGPRYLKGPVRFYSLNAVDLRTSRCGLEPLLSQSGQSIVDALWALWKRMGIPWNLQVDNAWCFYGSPSHPRGMGPLIRLCLHHRVEPWFIPVNEPWRNGVVEKFNDHYGQKFFRKVVMTSTEELMRASRGFEQKHNSRYRYRKLGGKTPQEALAQTKQALRFPKQEKAPQLPLEKPEAGFYHLVRLIRSDLRLNVFGDLFAVPPQLQYKYVVATIDVKEQKLKVFLDRQQVEEYVYKLR